MNVLVSGAYGGIGRAICNAYAAQGASLFITGREQEKLRLFADELNAKYQSNVIALAADVTCEEQIQTLFKTVHKSFAGLDVLVHCTGVLTEKPLMMTTKADIDNDIAVNLTSSILFCQQASKLMMRTKSGVITLLSSISAVQGSAGQSVYSASKAGINGLISSLAKELGPLGIRINGLAPGFIETEMVGHYEQDARASLAVKTCLGRLGRPEDIAPMVVFLSSQSSSYVTGQVISIDGGLVL